MSRRTHSIRSSRPQPDLIKFGLISVLLFGTSFPALCETVWKAFADQELQSTLLRLGQVPVTDRPAICAIAVAKIDKQLATASKHDRLKYYFWRGEMGKCWLDSMPIPPKLLLKQVIADTTMVIQEVAPGLQIDSRVARAAAALALCKQEQSLATLEICTKDCRWLVRNFPEFVDGHSLLSHALRQAFLLTKEAHYLELAVASAQDAYRVNPHRVLSEHLHNLQNELALYATPDPRMTRVLIKCQQDPENNVSLCETVIKEITDILPTLPTSKLAGYLELRARFYNLVGQVGPSHKRAHYLKAALDDYDKAISHTQSTVKTTDLQLQAGHAGIQLYNLNPESNSRTWQTAVAHLSAGLQHATAQAHHGLATAYLWKGRNENDLGSLTKALSEEEAAIKILPTEQIFQEQLIGIYYALNRTELAQERVATLAKTSPALTLKALQFAASLPNEGKYYKRIVTVCNDLEALDKNAVTKGLIQTKIEALAYLGKVDELATACRSGGSKLNGKDAADLLSTINVANTTTPISANLFGSQLIQTANQENNWLLSAIAARYAELQTLAQKAAPLYEKAAESCPDRQDALYALARHQYERSNDYEAVIAVVAKSSRSSDCKAADAIRAKIRAFFALSRYNEAMVELNKLLANDPQNSELLSWRANTWEKIGCIDKAIQDLELSLKYRPENIDLREYFCGLLMQTRRYGEAVDQLTYLLECMPNRSGWLLQRSQAYEALGNQKMAQQDLAKSKELSQGLQ